jgi:hypothetical protein
MCEKDRRKRGGESSSVEATWSRVKGAAETELDEVEVTRTKARYSESRVGDLLSGEGRVSGGFSKYRRCDTTKLLILQWLRRRRGPATAVRLLEFKL